MIWRDSKTAGFVGKARARAAGEGQRTRGDFSLPASHARAPPPPSPRGPFLGWLWACPKAACCRERSPIRCFLGDALTAIWRDLSRAVPGHFLGRAHGVGFCCWLCCGHTPRPLEGKGSLSPWTPRGRLDEPLLGQPPGSRFAAWVAMLLEVPPPAGRRTRLSKHSRTHPLFFFKHATPGRGAWETPAPDA